MRKCHLRSSNCEWSARHRSAPADDWSQFTETGSEVIGFPSAVDGVQGGNLVEVCVVEGEKACLVNGRHHQGEKKWNVDSGYRPVLELPCMACRVSQPPGADNGKNRQCRNDEQQL